MDKQPRIFEDQEAKLEAVPLVVGLVGPSGGGKTFSALRLATGIQRVTGGDIYVIDTEARRALHYADRFKFRHVAFKAPFGPLDYLAAIEHCVKKGAKIVITDSMSHEHTGPGGVLEMHAAETDRLAKAWNTSHDKAKWSAWQKPKSERDRMIGTILQMPITSIFCFRAKEKLKIDAGKQPKQLGFMPIAGEEFFFEMTVACLLLPRADGVPTWQSDEIGEKMTMKLPEQFKALFAERAPLSEDIGAALAKWAAGDEATAAAMAAETAAVDAVIAKIGTLGDTAASEEFGRYLDSEVAPKYPPNGRHGARIKASVDAAWAKVDARAPAAAPAKANGKKTAPSPIVELVRPFATEAPELILRALRSKGHHDVTEAQIVEALAVLKAG